MMKQPYGRPPQQPQMFTVPQQPYDHRIQQAPYHQQPPPQRVVMARSQPAIRSREPIYGSRPVYGPPQPMYVQGPPPQRMPVMGHPPPMTYYQQNPAPYPYPPPRFDYNPNFNYEEANFLCDVTIVENKVYCVICGSDFKASERDQHLKKHIRKGGVTNQVQRYEMSVGSKPSNKKNYIIKPIVEPEEHNMQYEPLVYNLVEEIVYQDPSEIIMQNQAIGYDQSFQGDRNMSVEYGRNTKIPEMKTQSNPFNNRGSKYDPIREEPEQERGNSLNQPSSRQRVNRSGLSDGSLEIDEGRNEVDPHSREVGV